MRVTLRSYVSRQRDPGSYICRSSDEGWLRASKRSLCQLDFDEVAASVARERSLAIETKAQLVVAFDFAPRTASMHRHELLLLGESHDSGHRPQNEKGGNQDPVKNGKENTRSAQQPHHRQTQCCAFEPFKHRPLVNHSFCDCRWLTGKRHSHALRTVGHCSNLRAYQRTSVSPVILNSTRGHENHARTLCFTKATLCVE